MPEPKQDIWARWLLERRSGGDRNLMRSVLSRLLLIRDKVLSHARLGEGETLLDVGCGDGLIAFGALEQTSASRAIFSDISQDLLDRARELAGELQVLDRCAFLRLPADDLSAIRSASVEVATTRSVLIYVEGKQKAFHEFYRVLKPGGRLSIFEPINRFAWPEPAHLFDGYDVTPVIKLAEKVKALYLQLQPLDQDPMLDFDERDLVAMAERAGFREIHLELQIEVKSPAESKNWEKYLRIAGNPKIPTLEEAMERTLTPDEAGRFVTHLRPLVESRQGTTRSAVAYLWAIKG